MLSPSFLRMTSIAAPHVHQPTTLMSITFQQRNFLNDSEGSEKGSVIPRAASAGAGSRYPPPVVHPHDFQHIKRAGEAGSRLRALGVEGPFEAPLMLAGACEGSREYGCEGMAGDSL